MNNEEIDPRVIHTIMIITRTSGLILGTLLSIFLILLVTVVVLSAFQWLVS